MRKMSKALVAWVAVIGFAPAAFAGPITGVGPTLAGEDATSTTDNSARDQREEADGVGGMTALFDLSGLPLLRIGAPSFLQLSLRNKLRNAGDAPLLQDASGQGFSGGGGGEIGNVGGGGGVIGGGGGSGDPGTNVVVPEPGLLLLMGSGLAVGLVRRRARR